VKKVLVKTKTESSAFVNMITTMAKDQGKDEFKFSFAAAGSPTAPIEANSSFAAGKIPQQGLPEVNKFKAHSPHNILLNQKFDDHSSEGNIRSLSSTNIIAGGHTSDDAEIQTPNLGYSVVQ